MHIQRILGQVRRVIQYCNMIEYGDKIAIGVNGKIVRHYCLP